MGLDLNKYKRSFKNNFSIQFVRKREIEFNFICQFIINVINFRRNQTIKKEKKMIANFKLVSTTSFSCVEITLFLCCKFASLLA